MESALFIFFMTYRATGKKKMVLKKDFTAWIIITIVSPYYVHRYFKQKLKLPIWPSLNLTLFSMLSTLCATHRKNPVFFLLVQFSSLLVWATCSFHSISVSFVSFQCLCHLFWYVLVCGYTLLCLLSFFSPFSSQCSFL